MNKGLSEYDYYKVIRPLYGEFKLDKNYIPVMNTINVDDINFKSAIPTNLSNLSSKGNNKSRIVFPFNSDRILEKYWNDPLKYIPLLKTTMLIGTPDFSLYENMNPNLIQANVFRNRWIGCMWQSYGINAIPTIGWIKPDTYDICFSGVEKGSVVMVSTIGCNNRKAIFIEGYNEMMKRLKPSLVIVYGKIIQGMYGTFVNYQMEECFNDSLKNVNIVQEELFEMSRIFSIKENDYGI